MCCRKSNLKNSLQVLREEVLKAKALVREANDLSQEMGKKTEFQVTLQIPANSLSPNRRVGAGSTSIGVLKMDRHFMDKLIFKKSNFLGLLNFMLNDFTVLLQTKLETFVFIGLLN